MVADTIGKTRGKSILVAIMMTHGPPLVSTMKEIIMMMFKRKVSCDTCYNVDQDTENKVACCNCCEDYDFYIPADEEIEDEYTLADLGHNWW
jgi:hypothetical protein